MQFFLFLILKNLCHFSSDLHHQHGPSCDDQIKNELTGLVQQLQALNWCSV
jgi:hypothetical protein